MARHYYAIFTQAPLHPWELALHVYRNKSTLQAAIRRSGSTADKTVVGYCHSDICTSKQGTEFVRSRIYLADSELTTATLVHECHHAGRHMHHAQRELGNLRKRLTAQQIEELCAEFTSIAASWTLGVLFDTPSPKRITSGVPDSVLTRSALKTLEELS